MRWVDFKNRFYSLLEIHPDDEDAIEIGVGTVARTGHTAFPIMEEWTADLDRRISEYGEDKSRDLLFGLMSIRLFTFSEFSELFLAAIDADGYQFSKGKIFDFLLIRDKEAHHFYTSHFEHNEDGYYRLLRTFDSIAFAKFFFRPIRIPYKIDDFKRNVYISGSTGVGKSELMKNLFYQFMKNKASSIVLIDPHGDLSEEILRLKICQEQKERIIYVDPYLSAELTPTINPFILDDKSDENIDVMTQELVSVFAELISNDLTMQMTTVLTPCISVLLKSDFGSLSELQRFMDDEQNEDLVNLGMQSSNPSHRNFFRTAFGKRDYRMTKQSIYTRLQSILNHRIFNRLVNGRSTIDLEKSIDTGKVIIMNLSQGRLGKDISSIFGKLVIAKLTSIAMKRAYKSKKQRKPTFLFIDEFHNYVTDSVEKILTETRKYGLHLIMANQSLPQIENKKLKEIMLGNTNMKFVGNNSPTTLSQLAKEIGVASDKLESLKKYQFYTQAGHYTPLIVNTTNSLNNPAYLLNKSEKDSLKQFMLQSRYYRNIQEADRKENYEKANADSKNISETDKTDSDSTIPKPKFKLDD